MTAPGPPRRLAWPALVAISLLGLAVPLAGRALHAPLAPPHFGLLAQALLHGRLYLDGPVYDGAVYHGRTYLPLGVLPALLMIPPVAVLGAQFPVLWLGVVALTFAIAGLWVMWRALDVERPVDRAWLTLAVVGGTVVLAAAVANSGYFVAHLVVIACLTWALGVALRGNSALACGVLVGLGALARTNVLLAALPLIAIYWDRARRPRDAALVAAPVALAAILLAAYNAARFGSPLSSGYELQTLTNPALLALRAQGLFSFSHVPLNIYYLLVAPPAAVGGAWPWLTPSQWGMGLVFVSPWLLLAVLARGRLAAWLWAGVLVVVLPSLLYYGVGWIQFGYRYALDGLPFLAALAALGHRRSGFRWLPALGVGSVVINVAGADWLLRTLGA